MNRKKCRNKEGMKNTQGGYPITETLLKRKGYKKTMATFIARHNPLYWLLKKQCRVVLLCVSISALFPCFLQVHPTSKQLLWRTFILRLLLLFFLHVVQAENCGVIIFSCNLSWNCACLPMFGFLFLQLVSARWVSWDDDMSLLNSSIPRRCLSSEWINSPHSFCFADLGSLIHLVCL